MPKSQFVDFKAIKAALTMEQVLVHYSLLDGFKRSGDSLSGPCPLHKGSNPTQFRVSLTKNVWNCFSKCKHGGNTLDFIAKMEGTRTSSWRYSRTCCWWRFTQPATQAITNPKWFIGGGY